MKIVDCPAPIQAKAADKTHIELGVLFFLIICKEKTKNIIRRVIKKNKFVILC